MKIMVIGQGGREHAIIKKLKESKSVTEIFVLPGNGGMENDAERVPIGVMETDKAVEFAKANKIDYAIVAPDDPLVAGAADAFIKAGIPVFGPDKKAARIEGSKAFAKNLMRKYNIPTAACEVFSDMEKALAYLDTAPVPIVIKADGLALGKGVVIAGTRGEAKKAVIEIMGKKVFGKSGEKIVIEEFLEGPEVSVLAFTDGKTIKPMVSSMDHKRAHDNDEGLNTGGMGTVAPNPYYTKELADVCMEQIFLPTVEAMRKEGCKFKGCLYFGLMLTKSGPKVIEYNCRFGDPETQVVLPLLDSDLFEVMRAVTEERLSDIEVKIKDKSACCVIMASGGYPEHYEKGFKISYDASVGEKLVFAGVKKESDGLYTDGGRVLGVVETAPTLSEAIDKAYAAAAKVSFKNAFYRKDIGKRALCKGEAE